MNQAGKKRRQAIKRTVIYTVMTTAVLLGTVLLVLFTLGYRFNRNDGTFSQGGLVQFISKPSGASVTVGSAQLANKTRSKITLNPGNYLVKLNLDGYQEWKKDIAVGAGKVLWLNSAQLIPNNPTTSPLASAIKLSSTSFRSDGKFLALIEDAKTPNIRVITTNEGKVSTDAVLTLSSARYSSGKKHVFRVMKWDVDSELLLVRHETGKTTEWIAVNVNDALKSVAIKMVDKAAPSDILFDPRSNNRLIVSYDDGTVRLVDVVSGDISEPIITNAADIALGSNWTVVYTTLPANNTRAVGYLTLGAKEPREIAAYADDKPLSAAIGDYYGATYLAVTHGKSAVINKVSSWPSSDSSDPLSTEIIHTAVLAENGMLTNFHGQGRFAAFQQGMTQTVYDLELGRDHAVPIVGVQKNLSEKLVWSDSFHFWNDASGYLRQYEFDGTNQAAIVKVSPGFDSTYDESQRYLYTIGTSDQGYQLQATKMIIE